MITKDTKISEILKINKDAIEIIASINTNFNKLRNPVLRKLFASRVSVENAAKVGDTTINNILEELEKIGFEVKYEKGNAEIKNKITHNIKSEKMKNTKIVKLDVRPILSSGVDPFEAIMDSLKKLNNDETLLIINTFEPIPLLNKLKKQGYEYEVERPEEQLVYTYLKKSNETRVVEEKEDKPNSELNFEEAEQKFAGKMHEVDVRDLEMPMPMVTILEEVEQINDGEALFVHHKKLPQYLLPELADRGYIYSKKEIDENNIKFIIYKK